MMPNSGELLMSIGYDYITSSRVLYNQLQCNTIPKTFTQFENYACFYVDLRWGSLLN